MNFFKFTLKLIKYSTITVVATGSGWVLYHIKHPTNPYKPTTLFDDLVEIKQNFLDNHGLNDDFVIELDGSLWTNLFNTVRLNLIKRLIVMSKHENRFIRLKSIRQLSKIHSLNDEYFKSISIMLYPSTAVGLARLDETDTRFFYTPNIDYGRLSKHIVNNLMKNLLIALYERSKHPCLEYFIGKAFKEFHDVGNLIDHDNAPLELAKFIQEKKQTNLIPICLESLLHHCSISDYAKDLIDLNGLTLLMEIYHQYKDDLDVIAVIARILSYVSLYQQSLHELYKIGWIKVLAEWRQHYDIRISIPASKSLTNLDIDDEPIYQQHLYPLHPSIRTTKTADIDVIFIHGLLGGVFYTWRQHDKKRNILKSNKQRTKQSKFKPIRIDPDVEALVDDFDYFQDDLLMDYEIVLDDLPINFDSSVKSSNLTLSGDRIGEIDDFYTYCWPVDWLSHDVDNLRIIGVNYETNLSMWAPICPFKNYKTLDLRCNELLEQLINTGIGRRPIVWVTHSMGGLMVKNLLHKAINSRDDQVRDLTTNTKGVIFYSTPHIGSSAAEFGQASSYFLWPSIEVQELRKNSTKLLEIHEKFLTLAKRFNFKIISFVETKPTIITAMKLKIVIVEPVTGNPGIGEYYEIPQDHLGICKPSSRYSFLYQKILELIYELSDDLNKMVK